MLSTHYFPLCIERERGGARERERERGRERERARGNYSVVVRKLEFDISLYLQLIKCIITNVLFSLCVIIINISIICFH